MEKPKLCVALDVDLVKALDLVKVLKDYPLIYKVGYKLFVPHGPEAVKKIKEVAPKGEIFLDLKLHDIPNTVRNGVKGAASLGVDYLTLHALGGFQMLKAASEVKKNVKLLGVTLLTSHGEEYLKFLGIHFGKEEFVLRLAGEALKGGCDGLVCSAEEVAFLKRELGNFVAVVPGIRPKGFEAGDQKRVATPERALEEGADILVVGRPIIMAENPVRVVEGILKLIGY